MNTINGDILSLKRGIIVQGCNSLGVQGSGIALQIKQKYPQVYVNYRFVFDQQGSRLFLGQIIPVKISDQLWIVNGITQEKYGRDGKKYVDYDAIETVFKQVRLMAVSLQLPVHYPMIGCGLGGGHWTIVEPIISAQLIDIEHHLWKQ